MKTADIRQAFITYFKQQNHHLVPSSSLIPHNDPTLLFTNAGMVQFKKVFTGEESLGFKRAVSVQRCVRAGGKHNDLENVGFTARHHTFFEMLGNFSFGDYFKREAIFYAWEFLTKILKLPKEKLWVTVFHEDQESEAIWLKEVGVSPERFSRCGADENFWSMGETGPCGPCTEIFYDHGPKIAGGPPGSPDANGDRYVEIWNLVFMQYERDAQGNLKLLPKPCVDTGMGLERIAAVVQGVHDNYATYDFQILMKKAADLSAQAVAKDNPALKVIADHLRASAFLITDGVMPSNEGRGYVLRRIIRRAVRYAHKIGLPSPFLAKLIPTLISLMGEAYPELIAAKNQVEHILTQEELQFGRTLTQGLKLLEQTMHAAKDSNISGALAFQLYDTYGFPLDLTEVIAREHNFSVDIAGFNKFMEQQQARSAAASEFKAHGPSKLFSDLKSEFIGYTEITSPAKIIAIMQNDNRAVEIKAKNKGIIVLNKTPCYPEGGGQVGDSGAIATDSGYFIIEDTKKIDEAIAHYGYMDKGVFTAGDSVTVQIDNGRREQIRRNHTATHLVHAALRQVLGSHVLQKGSLVEAKRARFDFTHYQPLSPKELLEVEQLVNAKICANIAVESATMSMDEANKSGALALFEEKYQERVRVLSIGNFSKELCGGTHVKHTGDIGFFKITSEYGVATGVRRIEIVTGEEALLWVNRQITILNTAASVLKTTPPEILEKIEQKNEQIKELSKEQSSLQRQLIKYKSSNLLNEAKPLNGNGRLLMHEFKSADMNELRDSLDLLKSSAEDAVIVLYTIKNDKIQVVAGIGKKIINKSVSAPAIVQHICGKGGGRNDMAQGGSVVPKDLKERLRSIENIIMEAFKASA